MSNLARQPPRQRLPRERDKDYLGFIASLSCVLCGAEPEVAHVRFAETCFVCGGDGDMDVSELPAFVMETVACGNCKGSGYRFGKRPTGAGEKPSDRWTLPLCPVHHRLGQNAQHNSGEREWWQAQEIDALALCKALQGAYEASTSLSDAIERGIRVLEDVR